MRLAASTLAGLLCFASPLAGQTAAATADSTAISLPRWRAGLAADISQSVGAFRQHVRSAAGAQLHVLLRLDDAARTAIRFEGGWLNYGHESQRSCLASTPGCRVAVNVSTANGILSLGAGPQFTVPLGRIRTYGYGLVGLSRFATVSGLGGGIVPDLVAGDENFGDTGLAWSGGVGVQLPVRQHTTIDMGLAYQWHGNRNYLIKGGVTDRADGTLAFDVKRSNVDLYAFRVGATTTIPWGRRTPKP